MTRGNERKSVFRDDQDRQAYLDRLARYCAQAIKGEEAFAERVLKAAGQSSVGRMGLTERDVASVIAKACGFSDGELGGPGRHRPRSRARILAAYLARAEGEIPVARMARYFGREESTLVRGVLRLEQELKADEDLRREVARLGKAVRAT